MKRILKEPLLHFVLFGAGIFLIYGLVNPANNADSAQQIVVGTGRIEQLATVFEKTWQRPPTDEELKGLIDDFVLEEAYYRRAVAMGIDRDDTIIRRRMRQKLEFLSDDTTSLVEATDEDLAAYLAAHQDRFRASPTYTFRQIYFNPEKHSEADISEQLEQLRSGKEISGDTSLLPESFQQVTRREADGTFGSGFSITLDELAIGQWQGPVLSGLGAHLILVDQLNPGRLPELDEIRSIVEREWNNEQRTTNRKKMNQRLLANYEVIIEWPNQPTAIQPASEGDD